MKELEQKKRGLIERIRKTRELKRKVVDSTRNLVSQYNSGEISSAEYKKRLNKTFRGRTPQQWVDYYDQCLGVYSSHLGECDKKIRRERNYPLKKIGVVASVFIALIILLVVFYSQNVVLFAPAINTYTQDLDLVATENVVQDLTLDNLGDLQSLMISGSIEGEGNVKIYIEDLLILDSANFVPVLFAPGDEVEGEVPGGIEEVPEETEEVEEVEEVPEEESLEEIEEIPVEEPPLEIDSLEKSPVDFSEENVTEDEKGIVEEINDTEIEAEIPEEVGGQEIEISIKDFLDYCEETCDLESFGLNESSYTLRIEISDAVLNFDAITYEILEEIDEEEAKKPKVKKEKKTKKGKEVEMSIPEDVEETIKTKIPKEWKIKGKKKLKVHWEEGDEDIEFEAHDLDDDGEIDEIEWIAPATGDQTFNIIVITKAEHLDSNLTFISDVYEDVRELDGNWSETISDGDYVRVTFAQELDSTNDITIYPRIVSGEPRIEIYEMDGTELIAEFTSLNNNQYNRIVLTALIESQDVFDLRIVGGGVEFDHIIDPPVEVCYIAHGAPENVGNYGVHKTFEDVISAMANTGNAIRSEYKWKAGGTGFEAHPGGIDWFTFNEKTSGAESYFFTDEYLVNTEISGTVYVSVACKDKNLEGQYRWTLYEYNPSDGTLVHELGSQVWDGTGADDPVDSELAISSYLVSAGNRLMLRVEGRIDDGIIDGELKIKIDETGTETSTPITSIHCNNVHNVYKAFLVMAITENEDVGPVNNPPTTPTDITCDGGSCDIIVDENVELQCSGSTDPDADAITYFLEAFVEQENVGNDLETSIRTLSESGSGAGWWDGSWLKRKEMILTGATSQLTDFPYYVNVIYDSDMQADYDDLRFTDDLENELSYEIESYDGSEAHVWVKIPTLTTGTNTIYMYYDNSVASSGEDAINVWDNNHVSVLHLNDVGTGNRDDSTSNNNDGVQTGYDGDEAVQGVISGADDFQESEELAISVSDLGYGYTMSAWFNVDAIDTWHAVMTNAAGDHGFYAYTGTIDYYVDGSSHVSAMPISAGTWYHAVITYDGTNGRLYINGDLDNNFPSTMSYDAITSVLVGNSNWGEYFDGTIDEVRVSNIARPADWITQSYDIVESQATYVSFGNEEEDIGGTATDVDTNYITYENVGVDFGSISEISVEVDFTSYDSSASVDQATTLPDLELEIFDGNGFVSIGTFNLASQTIPGSYSLTTTDPTILSAWETAITNQDVRVRGRYMDSTGALTDEIVFDNIFVTVNEVSWTEIGNHVEGSSFVWDTSLLSAQVGIDLRARAIDLLGVNTYSDYFTKGSSLEINHGITNTAPTVVITFVDTDNFVDFTNPGAANSVEIIFDVTDDDGVADIDEASLSIEYTFDSGGEATRSATVSACSSDDAGNTRTYTCLVDMEFYDAAGMWTATIDVQDNQAEQGKDTQGFQVNLLRDISLSPATISFPGTSPGGTNYVSLANTIITNRGNFDIPDDTKLQITSQNLVGQTNGLENIPGNNFRSADEAVIDVCVSGTNLVEGISTDIANVFLSRGISSTREVQHCLVSVPVGLSVQSYSTQGYTAWEIAVVSLLVAVIPAQKKKKKKKKSKKLHEDELKIISDKVEEFLDFSKDNQKKLKEMGIPLEKLSSFVKENKVKEKIKNIVIPLEIFRQEISPAEAVCKYLKENKRLKFSEIAMAISRNQRTVWINYRNAVGKKEEKIKIKHHLVFVPVQIFDDRKLSILESVVKHLKYQKIKNQEIAELLNKSPSNIWTINSRVEKKIKENKS
jgi:hypothetical protein